MYNTQPLPPRKLGRPNKGVTDVRLTIPPYLIAWAKERPEGMSGLVHRLLLELYQAEQDAAAARQARLAHPPGPL